MGRQAGVLWLLVAAADVGVAYAAAMASGAASGDERSALAGAAFVAGLSGFFALYTAIRLLIKPGVGGLLGATVWGVLNILAIGFAAVSGTGALGYGVLVFVVLATVASFMGWRSSSAAPS